MSKYNITEWTCGIGLMSGTLLDGIDLALCSFRLNNNKWEYNIDEAITYQYDEKIRKMLMQMPQMSGSELMIADRKLGKYYGELILNFLRTTHKKPEFIASHGHTIFHEPKMGMTFQAGHGASIAAETEIPVICDFRSSDVALNGQGAPLVPIGDKLLFEEFDALVNLGGFANISKEDSNKRIAFDICPVNIVFNHYARKTVCDFDKDGMLAAKGNPNPELLTKLNNLSYYSEPYPKSLGREWVEKTFLPIIEKSKVESINDILSTLVIHAVNQITQSTKHNKKILFTGGGVKNKFLIENLRKELKDSIVIPNETIIDFKEAMVFAFMGWLRLNDLPNTISSATGASKSTSAGAVYIP